MPNRRAPDWRGSAAVSSAETALRRAGKRREAAVAARPRQGSLIASIAARCIFSKILGPQHQKISAAEDSNRNARKRTETRRLSFQRLRRPYISPPKNSARCFAHVACFMIEWAQKPRLPDAGQSQGSPFAHRGKRNPALRDGVKEDANRRPGRRLRQGRGVPDIRRLHKRKRL